MLFVSLKKCDHIFVSIPIHSCYSFLSSAHRASVAGRGSAAGSAYGGSANGSASGSMFGGGGGGGGGGGALGQFKTEEQRRTEVCVWLDPFESRS